MAKKDVAESSRLHDADKELKASTEAVIRRLLLPIQQQFDDVVQRLERLEAGGGGPAPSPSSSAHSSSWSFKKSSNGQGAQSRVNSTAVKFSDKHVEQTKSMGRDLRADIANGANVGFHPGQGGNFGVPRNPRAQAPVPYKGGGTLTGPMQSMGSHEAAQRNGPDAYFDRRKMMSNNMKLSSRVRFMFRTNKWQQRRKVEGPKKIEEVNRDSAQERQQQSSRLARNPTINSSARRAPMEFGARGSTVLSSPNTQMGGFRAPPTQSRGFGAQDVRFEERQAYEARTLSVPSPQRTYGDDPLTLGPQGGLARGMSGRGPPAVASTPTADISSGTGDSRRRPAGLNGFSSVPERPTYNCREDLIPRYVADRFSGGATYDQLSSEERNMTFGNRDVELGISPPVRAQGSGSSQNVPSDKVWPEERLRDMSMAAIKEYYSARDDKEVALCIKDLKSPSFHPSMVSLWMVDSFERKDMERDLLAKLLVKLVQSEDGTLTRLQLTKGFESVLSTLGDVVNDAPRAAEFLGRMLAKTVMENAISLGEIGQLLYEGGEETGRLREVGLAGDVLGSMLETIKAEKGDNVLNEIQNASVCGWRILDLHILTGQGN